MDEPEPGKQNKQQPNCRQKNNGIKTKKFDESREYTRVAGVRANAKKIWPKG